jgi:hypothetical protein
MFLLTHNTDHHDGTSDAIFGSPANTQAGYPCIITTCALWQQKVWEWDYINYHMYDYMVLQYVADCAEPSERKAEHILTAVYGVE